MHGLKLARHRLKWLRRYIQLFGLSKDLWRFYKCRHSSAREPIRVRVRNVATPLWLRPGTTDSAVLWGVFGERFHRPHWNLLRDSPVIVDLGANVGFSMVDFATIYPGARILGVELDFENAALAKRNCRLHADRLTVVEAAIWSSDTRVSYSGTSEWAYQVMGSTRSGNESTVRALTMQSLIERYELGTIDYLKVDIEGAEAEIFAAPETWLQNVRSVQIEVHPPVRVETIATKLSAAGLIAIGQNKHPSSIAAVRPEIANTFSAGRSFTTD